MKKRLLLLSLVVLSIVAHASVTMPIRGTVIPASDSRIQYIGRINFNNPESPQFTYPGIQINARFEGTSIRMIAKPESGYFMATIDDCEAFKVAFSISGVSLELIEQYAPEMLDLLGRLAATGCVEFLAEPYSHGLSSLGNVDNFIAETKRQAKKIKQLFGQSPKVFRNSSLIYDDEIGAMVADMGFKGVMVEGAKHILGWKSPHYIYSCAQDARLSLILRDYKLSDDIGLRLWQTSGSVGFLLYQKERTWSAS